MEGCLIFLHNNRALPSESLDPTWAGCVFFSGGWGEDTERVGFGVPVRTWEYKYLKDGCGRDTRNVAEVLFLFCVRELHTGCVCYFYRVGAMNTYMCTLCGLSTVASSERCRLWQGRQRVICWEVTCEMCRDVLVYGRVCFVFVSKPARERDGSENPISPPYIQIMVRIGPNVRQKNFPV